MYVCLVIAAGLSTAFFSSLPRAKWLGVGAILKMELEE